jgi:hypothetical protein
MTAEEAGHTIFLKVLCSSSDCVKIKALNILFKELFLDATLSLTDGKIPVWRTKSEEDIKLASEFFRDILTEFSDEELEVLIDNGNEYMILRSYMYLFEIHKRHNETLMWIRESEEANSKHKNE